MVKKAYDGLNVVFVPVKAEDIVTSSKECEPVTIQYYIKSLGSSECETEEYEDGLETGASINWNQAPPYTG